MQLANENEGSFYDAVTGTQSPLKVDLMNISAELWTVQSDCCMTK